MIEKNTALMILNNLDKEAESLKDIQFYKSNNELVTWSSKVKQAINNIFSADKTKMHDFSSIHFRKTQHIFYAGMPTIPDSEHFKYYLAGLKRAQAYLASWIDEVNTYFSASSGELSNSNIKEETKVERKDITCFIVHGTETRIKKEVKLLLTDLNINSVILHEQVNRGKTILEKFEHYSDTDFAICIWYGDDEGNRKGVTPLNPRVRQNVMLETGYFWGKLSRDKVIILYQKNVEIPSDFSGLTYIKLVGDWRGLLKKEIDHILKM